MRDAGQRRRIAVDLTPIRRAGLNGGIKPLALTLLAGLADRGWEVSCLCSENAHDELAGFLPRSITLHAVKEGETVDERYQVLVEQTGMFDLNYFPMQRVSFTHPGSTTVSAIMDLQFADHPENFGEADHAGRADAFQSCVDLSDRIVAISAFTRGRIEALSAFPPDLVDVVHIALPPLLRRGRDQVRKILAKYDLEEESYVIYPANFWVHKCHRTLLEGYALYRSRVTSPVKLVLTGDLDSPLGAEIADRARQFDGDVVVTGFVSSQEIEILMGASRALIFPSSYEGFGIPLVEAMHLERPIAAAWSTCLPEVAGGAALLFDNTSASAIADAIARIVSDDGLRAGLVNRGTQRIAEIGDYGAMVSRYEQVFESALAMPRRSSAAPNGIFSDGWAGEAMFFRIDGEQQPLDLELSFSVPPFFPRPALRVTTLLDGYVEKQVVLWRGVSYQLRHRFEQNSAVLSLVAQDTFRPSELFGSGDTRELSLSIQSAIVRLGNATRDLLAAGAWRRAARSGQNAIVALSAQSQSDNHATKVMATTVPANFSGTMPMSIRQDSGRLILTPGPAHVREHDTREGQIVRIDVLGQPELAVDPAGPDCALLSLRSVPIEPPTAFARAGKSIEPGFSVVIPSYNQGRFIGRTIESVLKQQHISEIHVFDGGSADETVDVLRSFGDALRYDSRPDNGQAEAVNKGIAAGTGAFIAWINSDDTYEPDAFAHVADIFSRNPDIGVVYGEACHIDEYDAIIERYPTEDFSLSRLFETCFISQPATFFRRELVERHGGLRETLRYCMDYELWLRFASAGVPFLRTTAFLANTRFYADTKTLAARPQAHFEAADMLAQCFGEKSGAWIPKFAQIAAEYLEKQAGSSRDVAFDRVNRLAQAFWVG